MRWKAIEFERINLVCDTSGCSYKEEVEVASSDLMQKTCPHCGARLLELQDYKSLKVVLFLSRVINVALAPVTIPIRLALGDRAGKNVQMTSKEGEVKIKPVDKPDKF
jgi:hypothetical protein